MDNAYPALAVVVVAIGTGCVLSAEAGSVRTDESKQSANPNTRLLPHICIDHERHVLDLEMTVIPLDQLEAWLELLVCTKVGRDHESILTVKVGPSYVHLALLMMGLEPGSPMFWNVKNDGIGIEKLPSRPCIAVSAIYAQRARLVEFPINKWVLNQLSGKILSDDIWVFAGSKFIEIEGRKVYLADLNGFVLTLVNFGDELLTRPTVMTELNDEQSWVAVREMIPPVGAVVTLRPHPLSAAHPDRHSKQGKGPEP